MRAFAPGASPARRRAPVVYRMGVNLGDVLIEGDDLIGDGVNIAARLEGDRPARRLVHFGRGL